MNQVQVPPQPTAAQRNEWLDAVFGPVPLTEEDVAYSDAIVAFQNLTGAFVHRLAKSSPRLLVRMLGCIRFDYVGIAAMFKRFQRDAFGVSRFSDLAEKLVTENKLSGETKDLIIKEVRQLGLRVSSAEPRKTRIAAAFSLWMCVFRPVTFDNRQLGEVSPDKLEIFCAALNFYIASSFLSKLGAIHIGVGEEADIILERIKHDFTYRHVSMSVLETLYCSIFRVSQTCHFEAENHLLEIKHREEHSAVFEAVLDGSLKAEYGSLEAALASCSQRPDWMPDGLNPPAQKEEWVAGAPQPA